MVVAELVLQLVAGVAVCCCHSFRSCQHLWESSAWLPLQTVHVVTRGEDLVTSRDLVASVAYLFLEIAREVLLFVALEVAALAEKVAAGGYHVRSLASVHSAACCSTSLRRFLSEVGT